MDHTHRYTRRKPTSKIETCNCGAWRHVDLKPEEIIREVRPSYPAPWTIDYDGDTGEPVRADDDIVISAADGEVVCRVVDGAEGIDRNPDALAIAKLIALAPQMRDELLYIANTLEAAQSEAEIVSRIRALLVPETPPT